MTKCFLYFIFFLFLATFLFIIIFVFHQQYKCFFRNKKNNNIIQRIGCKTVKEQYYLFDLFWIKDLFNRLYKFHLGD